MTIRIILAILAACCASLASPSLAQTTLTFEGFSTPDGDMPQYYRGFRWTDFGYLDTATYAYKPSGYEAGVTSGRYVAFGGYFASSSLARVNPFQLVSFNMTAAWYDGLEVTATGRSGGVDIFTQLLTPSATAPTLYSFGGVSIDELWLASSSTAGSPHPGYTAGCCFQFVIDDLTVNGIAVPEPAQWALMLNGFALAGVAIRRRQYAVT